MKGALIPCGEAGDQRRSRFKLAGKSPEALWSGGGGLTFGEPGGQGETPHMAFGEWICIQRTMSAPQRALVTANRADLEMMWR